MKNWYTIGIVFLGGLAAGLLGFLFIQPAQTGKQSPETMSETPENDSPQQMTDASDQTATSSSNDSVTSTESTGDTGATEPSTSEEWEGSIETTSTPELIFYYKPG